MVMGVVGTAIDRVIRLPVGQIGRHICLAQEDGARSLQLADHSGIAKCYVVGIGLMTPAGGKPFDIEAFLDCHGNAEQGAFTRRTIIRHRLGPIPRPVEICHHHGVDVRIQTLDPRDGSLHRVERGHLAPAHLFCKFDSTGIVGQRRVSHDVSSWVGNVG